MNQDDMTNDVFNAKLSRLFAEKNESLPAGGFMTQLLPQLERAYRAQQRRRILLITVALLLATGLAPLVAWMTMEMASFAGGIEITPTISSILMIAMLVATLGVFQWSRKQVGQL